MSEQTIRHLQAGEESTQSEDHSPMSSVPWVTERHEKDRNCDKKEGPTEKAPPLKILMGFLEIIDCSVYLGTGLYIFRHIFIFPLLKKPIVCILKF